MGSLGESNILRRDVQVSTQDGPEQPTPRDETRPIPLKVITSGSEPLIRRKDLRQGGIIRIGQLRPPDVDFAGPERRMCGGGLPINLWWDAHDHFCVSKLSACWMLFLIASPIFVTLALSETQDVWSPGTSTSS